MSDFPLSSLSKKIFNEYFQDSSQSFTQIANNLKITRQTVAKYKNDKKKHFKEVKIWDPNKSNHRVFFTEIKTNPAEREIIPGLMQMKEIKSLDGIIGHTSLMAKFRVNNPNKKINDVLQQIDEVISKSEFQYYKLIDVLTVFKSSGKIFNETSKKYYDSLVFSPEFIKHSDFPFKWYLHLRPTKSTKYSDIARSFLVYFNEIIDLYRTGQEYGLLAVVRTSTVEQYQDFLRKLYQSNHFQDSFTIFVLDERLPSTFRPFRIEKNQNKV